MASSVGQSLVSLKDSIVNLASSIGNWFADLKTALQTFFENLGNFIVDGIKNVFESLFALDMDKVTSTVNLEDTFKSKFEVFYTVSDKFEVFYNTVSDSEVSTLSGGDYDGDVIDPLAINMQLPEWLGGQNVCILDMTEPELQKMFSFCRTFIRFGLWLSFITHLIHVVTPKFTISS